MKTTTHNFVFVTLEADDADPLLAFVGTVLPTGVLQLQDASLPCGTGLYLSQTHVVVSVLHAGRRTGGTPPVPCSEMSRALMFDLRLY